MPKWNNDFQAWEPDEIDSAAESELLLKHAAGNAGTSDKPGTKASTLFHSELAEREFSSRVLRVPDLLQWSAAQGLTIDTEPDIRAFEFVQADSLLAAIERKVGNTGRQATPYRAAGYSEPTRIGNGVTCWRKRLNAASCACWTLHPSCPLRPRPQRLSPPPLAPRRSGHPRSWANWPTTERSTAPRKPQRILVSAPPASASCCPARKKRPQNMPA